MVKFINTFLALEFPNLNLVVQPKKGSALIWPSVLDEDPNKKDERTEHGALPVKKGVKYGANAWIHQRGKLQIACSEDNVFNILIFCCGQISRELWLEVVSDGKHSSAGGRFHYVVECSTDS
jgi:hypothetical protein